MEISHLIIDGLWRPNFILKEPKFFQCVSKLAGQSAVSWDASPLNPKNRPDSLDAQHSRWRIDGATRCGTCLYAVPLDLLPGLAPVRSFVFLPDQSDWTPALRMSLDSSIGAVLRDGGAISQLAVSRHVCRALDCQCAQNPNFLDRYRRLPFGSRLVFENMTANVAEMKLHVVPYYDLESSTISLNSLHYFWEDAVRSCESKVVIPIDHLRLVKNVHDTVAIVQLNSQNLPKTVIFKSAVDDIEYLYHELRLLFRIPPHPNIMPRPLALVTKGVAFGGKKGIIGFLLPYFPEGSIRDILPRRKQAGTLTVQTKLEWCRQIASALIHIRDAAGTFYSELRPDNVLLHISDGRERLVLCDFEQRGNWHEWCPPEVKFRQYVENIRAANAQNLDPRWAELLQDYSKTNDGSASYTQKETFVESKNRPWFALSSQAQDSAMVYSFGLFVYTVFEGLSSVSNNIANKWPQDPDVEFPKFKHTPIKVQKLIRQCTVDAPEWVDSTAPSIRPPRARKIVRVGDKLCIEGEAKYGACESSFDELMGVARAWWETELERAANYLRCGSPNLAQNRLTIKQVMKELDSLAGQNFES